MGPLSYKSYLKCDIQRLSVRVRLVCEGASRLAQPSRAGDTVHKYPSTCVVTDTRPRCSQVCYNRAVQPKSNSPRVRGRMSVQLAHITRSCSASCLVGAARARGVLVCGWRTHVLSMPRPDGLLRRACLSTSHVHSTAQAERCAPQRTMRQQLRMRMVRDDVMPAWCGLVAPAAAQRSRCPAAGAVPAWHRCTAAVGGGGAFPAGLAHAHRQLEV